MLFLDVIPCKSQYTINDKVKLNIRFLNLDRSSHEIKIVIQIVKWDQLLKVEELYQEIDNNQYEVGIQYDIEYSSWKIGGYGIDISFYVDNKKVKDDVLVVDFAKAPHYSTRIAMVDSFDSEIEEQLVRLHMNYYFFMDYKFTEKSKNSEKGIHHLLYLPLKERWENHCDERRHWSIIDKNYHNRVPLDEVMNSEDHKLAWIKSTYKRYIVSLTNNIDGVILGIEGMVYDEYRSRFDIIKEINKLNNELFIYRDYYWPIKNYDINEQHALILRVRKPYCTYYQLKNIILEGKYFSHYKPVIIDGDLPRTQLLPKKLSSFKLFLATIFSNGGYYLLRHIYDDCIQGLIPYFDFHIRYKDILFEENVSDVTKIYYRYKDNFKCFENFNYSIAALENKVWIIIKENKEFMFISLINLYNNTNNWTQDKNEPHKLKNLKCRVPVDFHVRTLFMASPDVKSGRPTNISYEIQKYHKKEILVFKIDQLKYWNLIVITKEINVD